MIEQWMKRSRVASVWGVMVIATAGTLTACGDDDETTTTTPIQQLVAPTSVTATAPANTTKTVTVTWAAPAASLTVQSYNLYRSTTPNIAANLAAATKFPGVTSPYTDIVPTGDIPYYYVVTAVYAQGESAPSAEVTATPPAAAAGTFGNNLSVPIVFADGVGVTGLDITGTGAEADAYLATYNTGLRPTLTDVTSPFPYLNPGDSVTKNNVTYYPQRTSSTWQASWKNGKGTMQDVVVDWGDNLRSASLSTGQSIIRVETNLLQLIDTAAWPITEVMKAFPMELLGGQGINESQGTTGVAVDATVRRVYTVNARLKIQKLDGKGGNPVSNLCNYEGSIWEGIALPDSSQLKYSSEINVGGSITYGFNWRLGSCAATAPEKAGFWRITFSLDDTATIDTRTYNRNVTLTAIDAGDQAAAVLDSPTSSSIEVEIK